MWFVVVGFFLYLSVSHNECYCIEMKCKMCTVCTVFASNALRRNIDFTQTLNFIRIHAHIDTNTRTHITNVVSKRFVHVKLFVDLLFSMFS